MPDDKRSLLSNFHVRKYSEIFLVLLGSEIKHPPLANKTENVSKTITFGKEISKQLKFVFVAVHLKQGVPYYAETWVLVLIFSRS